MKDLEELQEGGEDRGGASGGASSTRRRPTPPVDLRERPPMGMLRRVPPGQIAAELAGAASSAGGREANGAGWLLPRNGGGDLRPGRPTLARVQRHVFSFSSVEERAEKEC
ncbi:hypothetical protein NL676_007215 [Syzygium grande]|nr:hypothetical protein NL676_007215 [Syzygium grande]